MKKLLLIFACAYGLSMRAMEQKTNPNPMPELLPGSEEFMECQSLLQSRNNELISLVPVLTEDERVRLLSLAKTQLSIDRMRAEVSMALFTSIRITAATERRKKSQQGHVQSSSSKSGPNVLEDLEKTGLIVVSLTYAFRVSHCKGIADLQKEDALSIDEYKRCVEYIKNRKHHAIPFDLLTCLNPHQRKHIKFLVKNQKWLDKTSTREAMYYEASKLINPRDSAAEQEETLNQLSLLPNKRMWGHLNRSGIMRAELIDDLKKISPFPSSDSDSEESSTESMEN